MLPTSHQVNVPSLVRLFEDTTNSYKHLFFLALLQEVAEAKQGNTVVIRLKDLIHRMLFLSVHPIYYYHLNFGVQDQIKKHLNGLDIDVLNTSNANFASMQAIKKTIKENYSGSSAQALEKYVPYRLLNSFFSEQLRGVKDQYKNNLISELALSHFDVVVPLYCIKPINGDVYLHMHPAWVNYFLANYAIVTSWAELHWINYLQRKNPNTPAISSKIYLPSSRAALSTQRKFWKEFIAYNSLECIFTGQALNADDFDLDHFIPWSYVNHDQYWNLIPISSSINRSKNNKLPSKKYIPSFCEKQRQSVHFALEIGRKSVIEDHLVGLQCDVDELKIYPPNLEERFHKTINSLIDIAALQGFEDGWGPNGM